MRAWRLLRTPPWDGARNMAVDEALLRARVAGLVPPTLRLYAWDPPTVSLGYGQAVEVVDLRVCAALGLGLVRRPTGGAALLHEGPDRELTYSVVARAEDFPGADEVLATYRVLGTALQAGLARVGVRAELVPRQRAAPGAAPAFCFARAGAYELAVGGRKLVGSAQRRQAGAFLQHGALLLDAEPARLRAVFPDVPDPAGGLTTLRALLGRPVAAEEVAAAVAAGFREVLGVALDPGPLTPAEVELAEELVRTRYGATPWTLRGALGDTPRAPAASRAG